MKKKENALPGAATPERARECLSKSDFPCSDFTTSSTDFQGTIESLLHRGRESAIPARDLAAMVGATSVRELQQRIAVERQAGALILSTGSGGYFRPSCGEQGRQEIAAFIRTLRARAVSTLKVLRAAKASLAQTEGQLGINEMEGGFDEL